MIYSKKIEDMSLLQSELKKVKALYIKALNKKEGISDLQQVRKRIKLLSSRIDLINSYSMPNINFQSTPD